MKGLMTFGPFKAFKDSINVLSNNLSIITPFFIETITPTIITFLIINLVTGMAGVNYYYGTDIITSPATFNAVLLSLFISGIISALVMSYFNAAGLIMGRALLKGKKMSLRQAFHQARHEWLKMSITMLTLTFTGLMLIFPVLLIITLELGAEVYWSYTMIASMIFLTLLVYPRVITIKGESYGFKALWQGFKTFYSDFGYNIVLMFVIGVIVLTFSWFSILGSTILLLINGLIVMPWINLLVLKAHESLQQ